ncbi:MULTISPECIES: glycosyltransferase family 2 protein [Klebsiella pneumoniae complex]|uniref:glycosyltransferase family 2 protein n=1 Tax=Klebsiella pneumoniae complex TaxID=3390273 RepID=UPI0021A3EBE6|nr:glycosyltransferase family 2 protein [Klebsiella variicola]UWS45736.1 glycosyltransferase family 2 protein [Klebsiella variicola]HDH1530152.1 glycosyltransferase family 2 protein [Klebsiella quasipneumoniae subsp. similipneumoniae]
MNINDKIAILLCTYNGEKYLKEQVDSIISQTHKNWVIYVSDDGSTDGTIAILEEYQNQLGKDRLCITHGPRRGFAWNFISSLQKNGQECDYFAFCDQDDIWCATKLEDALNAVKAHCSAHDNEYVLYGSRTFLIDSQGQKCGASPCFQRPFGLQNALVQSFSGGNTMLLSHRLKEIIESFPDDMEIVSHDWFLYLVCSALGGKIIYDEKPKVLYRQHGDNLVGSNLGLSSKLTRLKKIYSGDFKRWNEVNERNLFYLMDNISPENREVISTFYHKNKLAPFWRLRSFIHAGVYRQSKFETIFFMIMSFMGKLR